MGNLNLRAIGRLFQVHQLIEMYFLRYVDDLPKPQIAIGSEERGDDEGVCAEGEPSQPSLVSGEIIIGAIVKMSRKTDRT